MQYGVRWDDQCLKQVERIFGSLEEADDAIATVDWHLAHDPYSHKTWMLIPNAKIRMTWVKPHRVHPATAYSYEVMTEAVSRYCVVRRAVRANVPGFS
jgi:hypothetical protein